MGKFHVYFTPPNGATVEVTEDVLKGGLTPLKEQLDNTEYDVGIFRVSDIKVRLRNDHGRYAEPGTPATIFPVIRNGSIVKITWEPGPHKLVCGFFKPLEAIYSEEIDVFEGILTDDATRQSIEDQTITFQVLGFAHLFDRAEAVGNYENVDFQDTIFGLLNVPEITDILTVDTDNIECSVNVEIDDDEFFENKTVLEALSEVLRLSNSILYIRDRTVFVTPRTPSNELKYSFYGQSSVLGVENLLSIKNYSNGLNRVFNLVRWSDGLLSDTTISVRDTDSINQFGVYRKNVQLSLLNNTGKIETVLEGIRDEFSFPFVEFELESWLSPQVLELFFLDRVQVDNPSILVPAENQSSLPFYGSARYGQSAYPVKLSALNVPGTKRFKILSRSIDLEDEKISFSLREIPLE